MERMCQALLPREYDREHPCRGCVRPERHVRCKEDCPKWKEAQALLEPKRKRAEEARWRESDIVSAKDQAARRITRSVKHRSIGKK